MTHFHQRYVTTEERRAYVVGAMEACADACGGDAEAVAVVMADLGLTAKDVLDSVPQAPPKEDARQ